MLSLESVYIQCDTHLHADRQKKNYRYLCKKYQMNDSRKRGGKKRYSPYLMPSTILFINILLPIQFNETHFALNGGFYVLPV